MRVGRGQKHVAGAPGRIREMSRLAKIMRLVDSRDGAAPRGEGGKSGPDDCRDDELATRHFFFFLGLAAAFALALLAGFFAPAVLADPDFVLPNAFSQLAQK